MIDANTTINKENGVPELNINQIGKTRSTEGIYLSVDHSSFISANGRTTFKDAKTSCN